MNRNVWARAEQISNCSEDESPFRDYSAFKLFLLYVVVGSDDRLLDFEVNASAVSGTRLDALDLVSQAIAQIEANVAVGVRMDGARYAGQLCRARRL